MAFDMSSGFESAGTSQFRDVMNDTSYNPQTTSARSGSEEVDTCRICRGEATELEPLFYPCNCSGSIKFVHQDCLMEWLAHSQKKHCELCKTSFRFTKLYHPKMPSSLPATVFLRRATIHTIKTLLTWCRIILVVCVWLFWLPWCMRFVWWGLFFVGDGGWASELNKLKDGLELESDFWRLAHGRYRTDNIASSTTRPHASHPSQSHTSSPSQRLSSLFGRFPRPVSLGRLATFFGSRSSNSTQAFTDAPLANTSPSPEVGGAAKHSSLLSSLDFFQTLTPNRAVNKFVTDILEGQIITLLVVIAVILVFLIREWVVQQQPGNLGALHFMDAAPILREHDAEIRAQEEEATREGAPRNDDSEREVLLPASEGLYQGERERQIEEVDGLEQNNASSDAASVNTDTRRGGFPGESSSTVTAPESSIQSASDRPSSRSRPAMPPRAQSSLAATIQMNLEDDSAGLTVRGHIDARTSAHDEDCDLNSSDRNIQSWQHVEPTEPSRFGEVDAALGPERSFEAPGHEQGPSIVPSVRLPQNLPETETTVPSVISSAGVAPHDDGDASIETNSARHSGRTTHSLGEPSELPPNIESQESNNSSAIGNETGVQQDRFEAADGAGAPNRALLARFWDWLWGDIAPSPHHEAPVGDEEQIVQDIDDEPPFVPFLDAQPHNHGRRDQVGDEDGAADGVDEAARPAAEQNDADAVDEMEDLEGILELVGMQGPLLGLVQNALFCAVLVSATVTTAVWFPYLWGKVVLLFLASPSEMAVRVPLRLASSVANFAIDFCIFLACSIVVWISATILAALYPLTLATPSILWSAPFRSIGSFSSKVADAAVVRIWRLVASSHPGQDFNYTNFSLNSHVALRTLEAQVSQLFSSLSHSFRQTFLDIFALLSASESSTQLAKRGALLILQAGTKLIQNIVSVCMLLPSVSRRLFLVQSESKILAAKPMDPQLVHWTSSDRAITVAAGYAFFMVLGAAYLKRGTPFSTSRQGKKIEAGLAEVLQQAGGIFKVILIISIEMIAFPFYCGVLLDLALLPLFPSETNSFQSRVTFASNSPWTAAFVHWFIGTCYMFHFALFVSMCRKAMRSGVLYFIRDPDDPTFHPVRDVLERNVSSQLRKIGFSALVYGALVIICMGSVVWAVAHFCGDVLPIRWSSRSSVREFPADLLLYNFLTPIVVHLFKPSKGLHVIYNWWLRRCAHQLRLSDFLFGERHADEEGRVASSDENEAPSNGTFVRAPASDQVRIPKGHKVFLEVDQDNNRLDGLPDLSDGVHGKNNQNFTIVYIPPFFRFRLFLFVACLWALTIALGLAATLGPLLVGRWVLCFFISETSEMSDIYAFSIGICIFGGIVYSATSYRDLLKHVQVNLTIDAGTLMAAFRMIKESLHRILRVLYTYSAFAIVIPSVFALLLEFYVIMPLHAYLASTSPQQSPDPSSTNSTGVDTLLPTTAPSHTIFFLQDWTLGVLYARIALRILLSSVDSRPARALRAVVAQGWTNPNARLATRCFIAPVAAISAAALLIPAALGSMAARIISNNENENTAVQIRRLAYPAVLALGIMIWLGFMLARAIGLWRSTIRDEVYLIGERLHNFGESRPPKSGGRSGTTLVDEIGSNRRGLQPDT